MWLLTSCWDGPNAAEVSGYAVAEAKNSKWKIITPFSDNIRTRVVKHNANEKSGCRLCSISHKTQNLRTEQVTAFERWMTSFKMLRTMDKKLFSNPKPWGSKKLQKHSSDGDTEKTKTVETQQQMIHFSPGKPQQDISYLCFRFKDSNILQFWHLKSLSHLRLVKTAEAESFTALASNFKSFQKKQNFERYPPIQKPV